MTIDDSTDDPVLPDGTIDLAAGVERTAAILLERYGAEAVAFATSHILPLQQKGAVESAGHWRLVVQEIERLLAA